MNSHLKAFLIVLAVWIAAVVLLYAVASAAENPLILMLVVGLLMYGPPLLGLIGLLLLIGYLLQRRRDRILAANDPHATVSTGESADRSV